MPPMLRRMINSQLKDDAYTFVFSQKGLMPGVSIEGTRMFRIKR
jgi:lipid-binding SYLF domain-containing protein